MRLSDQLHHDMVEAMQDRIAAEVAERAGLSRQYVHNLVNRKQVSASRDHLRTLLDELGLELADYDTDPIQQPQPWTLPAMFDTVGNEDRVEAERILAWMLALRRRSESE